jgi:hypothetical protein
VTEPGAADARAGAARGRAARVAGRVLTVVAVVAFSLLGWRKLLRGETDVRVVAAGIVVVLGAIALGFWLSVRRSQARHHAVAARRPGWRLHDVWADWSLSGELMRIGLWERRLFGGSRLTLAWSPGGAELWRGRARAPREVVSVPWAAVASVTTGRGHAGSTERPAVVVALDAGARLVLVPARRALGGVLPADAGDVDALVRELRAARDGS